MCERPALLLNMSVNLEKKYDRDTVCAQKKLNEALKVLNEQAKYVVTLQEKVVAADSWLKEKKSLYEAIQNECNMKSKLFIEIQGNIELVKRHLQITNSLINQLKDEISKLHGKITASEQTFCSKNNQIKKLCNIIFLSFFLLVRPPMSQSLLIMGWCSSIPEHRLRLHLDSGPIR